MNSPFDFGEIRPLHYFFGTSAFLGVVFAFVSENNQSNFLLHLGLWLLQTMGPIIVLVICHITLHKITQFDRLNLWFKLFVSGILGAFIFSPFALGLDFLWGNDPLPSSSMIFYDLWLNELIAIAPPITLCWMAINAPWILGSLFAVDRAPKKSNESPSMADHETIKEAPLSSQNCPNDYPFYNLLTRPIKSELLYIKSELHYLLVVTELGRELILYNLKDAISEIPLQTGSQPHRSFWVAYKHIETLAMDGRQGNLTMSNSDIIPVSRTKLKQFKIKLKDKYNLE